MAPASKRERVVARLPARAARVRAGEKWKVSSSVVGVVVAPVLVALERLEKLEANGERYWCWW